MTDGLVLDEKLVALRRQMGEAAWADRLAEARAREETLLKARALVEQGFSLAEARERSKAAISLSRLRQWHRLYAEKGLVGLISRLGRITITGFQDPLPRRPRRHAGTKQAASFVKWVGSKRAVAELLVSRAPRSYERYFEPMVGSGVVFLALRPQRAVLADVNEDLMLCYAVLRDDVEGVIAALSRHRNTAEHYHRLRALPPSSLPPVQRAARFIFLNKTCFNGLYRVNRRGQFNVPYGRFAHAEFCDESALRKVSAALQGDVELRRGDVASSVADAAPGDFVYLDPPYLARSQRLIRYSHSAFDERQHRRLAHLVTELHEKGVNVMISNSNLPLARHLYRDFRIEELSVRRMVGASASSRGLQNELLIRTFDLPGERPRRSTREESAQLPLAL